MTYPWVRWLKDWRTIANTSSPTADVSIVVAVDGADYEVLRVSRFHVDYDAEKPHVETSIRAFNDRTALFSKATRDLGIVRVITSKHKPMFVVEPGADVFEWRSATEGVSVGKLVKAMREGDLGRRIRRRDRKAAKDSQERLVAIEQEYQAELQELGVRLKEAEQRAAEQEMIADRMRKSRIEENEELGLPRGVSLSSGPLADTLGKAQKRGTKLTSSKPLPGNFEGKCK